MYVHNLYAKCINTCTYIHIERYSIFIYNVMLIVIVRSYVNCFIKI